MDFFFLNASCVTFKCDHGEAKERMLGWTEVDIRNSLCACLCVWWGVLFNENICHGVVTFVNLFPSFTLLAPGATLLPQNAH